MFTKKIYNIIELVFIYLKVISFCKSKMWNTFKTTFYLQVCILILYESCVFLHLVLGHNDK